jgi:hypothetical protein
VAFDGDGELERLLAERGADAPGGTDPPHLWEPGREVGGWTVTAFLARGGSAETYCARHRRLGTAAALKVLWRGDEAAKARFERETRFLMDGPDPAFPALCGTGEEEGRAWVAMELLDDYPLPSSDAEVARYLSDAARGVAVLHARGWLHRDLKPGNILRRASDGRAVLADFGLLKPVGANETVLDADSPSVVDGREAGVGTPGYAAPEQFAGGGATPATDVYALGMLADACFGGKPPRAWERIVRRATGAIPRQRFASAEEFLRAVRRRHWRRNGWLAALMAAAAVLLAAATALLAPATAGVRAGMARLAAARRLDTGPGKAVVEDLLRDLAELSETASNGAEGRPGGGPCLLARHEVTQAQWEVVMGSNPSRFRGADRPVEGVTVAECLEFAGRLNRTAAVRAAGLAFRLPTRREWLWAIVEGLEKNERFDSKTLKAEGWFVGNSGGETHPVGTKKANALGFADLLGNVAECTSSGVWWRRNPAPDSRLAFDCVGGSCLTGQSDWEMTDGLYAPGAPLATLPGEFRPLFRDVPAGKGVFVREEPSPATALRGNLVGLRLCADRTPQ